MATTSSDLKVEVKDGLGWIEWPRGLFYVVYEMLFQKITAHHLQNPMPLPPVNHLTCIVTGSTSGIGFEISRQLAEAGAHVVMAVRNSKAAKELIQKWQNEWSGMGLPLNIEVQFSYRMIVVISTGDGTCLRGMHGWDLSMFLSIMLGDLPLEMHYVGFIDTDDMNVVSGKRKYTSLVGYSSSKLAQIMFNSVLHKRLPADAGICVTCVSPGIVQTNVTRDLPRIIQAGYRLVPYFIFSPQEGSRSALFAATDPQVPEYCQLLKSDDFPVCAFISQDCSPTNPWASF